MGKPYDGTERWMKDYTQNYHIISTTKFTALQVATELVDLITKM